MIDIVNPQPPTPRQMQVGELWAMGRTAVEIGKVLFITNRTAENHVTGFYQCTGCECRGDVFDWFKKNIWHIDTRPHYACHNFIIEGRYHTATIPAGSYEVSIEYV